MKTVLIMLMMCGQPETLLVVQEDQQVYYKIHELDRETEVVLLQLLHDTNTIKVQYEDPDKVCI